MFRPLRQRVSASAFHPELRRVSRFLPNTLVTPVTVWAFARLPRIVRPHPNTDAITLPSGLAVRVHQPSVASTPGGAALLWIHGGGYVLGSAAMDDGLCRRLAEELGILVAAVDYRLAPAHPYPAALIDCYETLTWLAAHPEVDAKRVAVAGASAGGGLAAALALMARDRGEVDIAAQILLYPMLDDRTAMRRDADRGLRRLWNNASNALGWSAYLVGADPHIAVPARRGDLRGIAPAWIGVGTLDVLCDESYSYAERLREADVECRLEVVPGAFHGFDAVAPESAISRRFLTSQCTMLRDRLRISTKG
ncbi:alpha/beta hydrolase [Mycolicibacterium poriferae]|nr:alpha/beta hydrolase [Mycolicibacterium poriferae]